MRRLHFKSAPLRVLLIVLYAHHINYIMMYISLNMRWSCCLFLTDFQARN